MAPRRQHPATNVPGGFALTLVLVFLLLVGLVGVGILAIATSDLHGAIATRLALEARNAAEAGLHYGAAQLIARALADEPSDEAYAGEPGDLAIPRTALPRGTVHLTVTCVYPAGATPPACRDDPTTADVDERDLRHLTAVAGIPGGPGGARRRIEATLRRYDPRAGDTPYFCVCGRDGVELEDGTTITSDVGSNGDIHVGLHSAIRQLPLPAPTVGPSVVAVPPPVPAPLPGLTGTYSWRVTFLDSAGRESSGSPATRPLRLAGDYADLTDLPVGAEGIVHRRLYRSRAGAAATGPWFLVVEIPNNTDRDYTDPQPDDALGPRVPGTIAGAAVAVGAIECADACRTQVAGGPHSNASGVPCPAFLPPPCRPGRDPAPRVIAQNALEQEVRFAGLHVNAGDTLSILTVGAGRARLHIHVADLTMERGATIVVTGQGTVYVHVRGAIHLGADAVMGVEDAALRSRLITPSDRVQLLSCARDPAYDPQQPQTASVRWDLANRVSAFVFAPEANIVIGRADAIGGAVFGKHILISGSTGTILDPSEGVGSETAGIRPSPFQYLIRWYDSPTLDR